MLIRTMIPAVYREKCLNVSNRVLFWITNVIIAINLILIWACMLKLTKKMLKWYLQDLEWSVKFCWCVFIAMLNFCVTYLVACASRYHLISYYFFILNTMKYNIWIWKKKTCKFTYGLWRVNKVNIWDKWVP